MRLVVSMDIPKLRKNNCSSMNKPKKKKKFSSLNKTGQPKQDEDGFTQVVSKGEVKNFKKEQKIKEEIKMGIRRRDGSLRVPKWKLRRNQRQKGRKSEASNEQKVVQNAE